MVSGSACNGRRIPSGKDPGINVYNSRVCAFPLKNLSIINDLILSISTDSARVAPFKGPDNYNAGDNGFDVF